MGDSILRLGRNRQGLAYAQKLVQEKRIAKPYKEYYSHIFSPTWHILTQSKTPCCYFVKCFNTKQMQNHEKTKCKTRVYILMQALEFGLAKNFNRKTFSSRNGEYEDGYTFPTCLSFLCP